MPKLRRVKIFFSWQAADLEKQINEWFAANPNLIYQIDKRVFKTPATHGSVGFSLYLEYLTTDPAEPQ